LLLTSVKSKVPLPAENSIQLVLHAELALEQHAEADQARAQSGAQEAAQVKQAQAAKTAQSLGPEREKTTALAQEAAAARQELTAITAQHRQALDEERARGTAVVWLLWPLGGHAQQRKPTIDFSCDAAAPIWKPYTAARRAEDIELAFSS
jgi:hypothetical protein